jgi:hypothetical protein
MTVFLILSFLAYSAFCWWVVFWDGAEILEGWKAAVLFDWAAFALTESELRFSVGISWFVAVVLGLIGYYS